MCPHHPKSDFLSITLAALSGVVVFSAAVPLQGGTAQINEQWPSYWIARFAWRGYAPLHDFRHPVWPMTALADYYAQNLQVFVPEAKCAERTARLKSSAGGRITDMVHPRCWQRAHDERVVTLREHLTDLPRALKAAPARRLRKGGR